MGIPMSSVSVTEVAPVLLVLIKEAWGSGGFPVTTAGAMLGSSRQAGVILCVVHITCLDAHLSTPGHRVSVHL